MAVNTQEKEIKRTRNLAIVAVSMMVVVFVALITYKQDSIKQNLSITNIDVILMLAMLIPIGVILKLLCQKTKEVANLREQFYQSQKMEAIGRLAGGIAHDFNNILASSTGYAEFLVEDLADIDPKLQNFAKQILLANKQAQKLVEQILSFSRKQENIELDNIDLREAIKETVELLKSTIKQGISLNTDIADYPIMVNANHNLLHQLIVNLCVNAVDAMIPQKIGTLNIRTYISNLPKDINYLDDCYCNSNMKFTNSYIKKDHTHFLVNGIIKPDKNYAIIEVEDTGTGIPQDILRKIFDPFFTTKDVNKGTGLGLSSALNIIEMHDGGIVVKTEIGVGTKFVILLPVLDEDVSHDTNHNKAENKNTYKDKSLYILLIEDDMTVAGTMEIMLERMGHETIHCLNPLEAMDLLEAGEKFDLIISDYKMPHMTGLEMAKELYKKYPNLPIIMTTGFSDKKIGTKLNNTNIIKLLKKPLRKQEIETAIKEALAK